MDAIGLAATLTLLALMCWLLAPRRPQQPERPAAAPSNTTTDR